MSRKSCRGLFLAATCLGCWVVGNGRAHAQEKTAPATPTAAAAPAAAASTTIAVEAKLVTLPVVVHDKKGALVQTLTKADFTLQVDGHPQPIRYFDKDTNLPLTLGLLVDTSRSVSGKLDEERSASAGFLDGMLQTGQDRAFVIQFAHQTELLQDLTNSRPKLQASLKELDTESGDASSPSSNDSDSNTTQRHGRSHGGTALYDATFLAADELLAKQTGRKALVLLTDGEDRGSKESLASAIEAAQRANTVVYAIYFKGQQPSDHNGFPGNGGGRRGGGGGYPGGGYPGGGYPGGGGSRGGGRPPEQHVDGKKVLERITDETGGRLFEISKRETVAVIYDEIAQELRAQYRLGFTPDKDTAAEGYHQIDLSASRPKDLFVQTRDGYYTGK